MRESDQTGPSGKTLERPNHPKIELDVSPCGVLRESGGLQPFEKDSSSAIAGSCKDWDITGFLGADLLSENVRILCLVILV